MHHVFLDGDVQLRPGPAALVGAPVERGVSGEHLLAVVQVRRRRAGKIVPGRRQRPEGQRPFAGHEPFRHAQVALGEHGVARLVTAEFSPIVLVVRYASG